MTLQLQYCEAILYLSYWDFDDRHGYDGTVARLLFDAPQLHETRQNRHPLEREDREREKSAT